MNVNNEQNNQFQQEFKPDIAALMQTQFTNGSQCGVNMLETQSVNASSAQIYGSQVYGVNVGVGGLQLGSAAPKSESGSYNDLFISTASDQYSVGVGLGGGTDIMAGASTPPGGSTTSSKYQCAICGDRASGKHYGVFSCEGCKGFFKRTVRKDLTYTCRDERNCPIDKRQRNRCQFCRYNRCLAAGMKREAVQEERLRAKEKAAASGYVDTIDYRRVLQAEVASDPCDTEGRGPGALATEVQMQGAQPSLVAAADRQLYMLVEWAKRLPHFVELPLDDQIALLRAGWNELLIAAFAFRSTQLADADALLIANGVLVRRDAAHSLGVGAIFDRVLVELVAKMREMKLDRVEIGCLRAIILFNADVKSLQCVADVEAAREKYYTTLEEYCKATYPAEPARFARILLRMPALRSIGLKCLEQLFFFKLLGESPADSFLVEMLNETLLKNADDYHQSPPPPPPVGLPQLSTAGGAQPRLAYAAGGVYSNAGALNAGF